MEAKVSLLQFISYKISSRMCCHPQHACEFSSNWILDFGCRFPSLRSLCPVPLKNLFSQVVHIVYYQWFFKLLRSCTLLSAAGPCRWLLSAHVVLQHWIIYQSRVIRTTVDIRVGSESIWAYVVLNWCYFCCVTYGLDVMSGGCWCRGERPKIKQELDGTCAAPFFTWRSWVVGRVDRPNRATTKIYAAMDTEGDTLFVVIIS